MTPPPHRKLIEVSLPLEKINAESAREKSIRHGHPSTLHLWWARRPLAAARAVLFAQLVDDPSCRPEALAIEDDVERDAWITAERDRLHRLIEELVVWENTTDEALFARAHAEIMRDTGGNPPPVLDPFAGGGSIPLEAQRLGLRAQANDLNPLPVLLNTVMLELTGRFNGLAPISGGIAGSPAQTLATDLRHYAAELEQRVARRVGHLYPRSIDGAEALVYFWARTVTCSNPACRREVPLVGSWTASGRRGSEATFVPKATDDGAFDVEIVTGPATEPEPTMRRTGGRCPACTSALPLAYVKQEGVAGRLGTRLLALQSRQGRTRFFVPATAADRDTADVPAPATPWLDLPLSTHPQYMAPPRYGMTSFRDLFSPRQLVLLHAFVEELDRLLADMQADALASGAAADNAPFAVGGTGYVAYGEALKILLALGIGRLVNRQSSLCIWDSGATKVNQVFSRQAYSMTWFHAEANPFAGASGSFSGQVAFLAKSIETLPGAAGATITQGPAQTLRPTEHVVVSTDPPYYDSVPYADLADFFHVWHRRMLGDVLPTVFSTVLTPKAEELVADQLRWGGKGNARVFFEEGMQRVFDRLGSAHDPETPMAVYYAFKQGDSEGGSAPTGWESMLTALIDAGWRVTGTWPVRTEQAGGLRELGRNALASSVVIVCRRRDPDARTIDRRAFLTALRSQLPAALAELQQGALAPVDLPQAAVGPGMAVFTRYAAVLGSDGTAMSVREALQQINQLLDEVLSEQEADFDTDTRFLLTWFRQYGFAAGPYGDADNLARARNASIERLKRAGVLTSHANAVQLIAPANLPSAWSPATDPHLTVWEVVLHLAKLIVEKGVPAAAAVYRDVPASVDLSLAKELAYLLFRLAEQRKQTADAITFNALAAAWNDVAQAATGRSIPAAGQLEFPNTDDED